MNPLSEFVQSYLASDTSRMHMPGHKGNCGFLRPLGGPADLTEIAGADALYAADGVIAGVERQLAALYGSQAVLSAGGSTLCIQTMLALTAGRPLVAMRNSHAALFNSCALLDIQPRWLLPDVCPETGLALPPSPRQIERALDGLPNAAVYLTSPDYLGVQADIAGIASVCRKRGALLLVDNAHGAHLRFLPEDAHPISMGADLCCDSLHKTLPALTGAAALHTRRGLFSRQQIKSKMALFGSSSPSYLILQSIGLCADWLEREGRAAFALLQKRRAQAAALSGCVLPADPAKLPLDAAAVGLTGEQLAARFRAAQVEPEYVSRRHVLLLPSPFSRERDWERVESVLQNLPAARTPAAPLPKPPLPERVLSLRRAALAPCALIPVAQAAGRVAAENRFLCPPGVPVVLAGERISPALCALLAGQGLETLAVVQQDL